MSKRLSPAARAWKKAHPWIIAEVDQYKGGIMVPNTGAWKGHLSPVRFLQGGRRRNKFNARKVKADGHTFDSMMEFARYRLLRDLQAAGKISGLTLQKRFELQPALEKNGKKYRAIYYVADFAYQDAEGRQVVEDTKGFQTEAFKMKRKMFEFRYPDLTLKVINGKR